MNFETLAVHAAKEIDAATGAIVPPLHLSTTFGRNENLELLGPSQYVREGNPTQDHFERALAAIEGGELGLAFASGSAASTAVLQALPAGSHVLFPDDAYYGMYLIAEEFFPLWGLSWSTVSMRESERFRAALRPETRLVWLESPSNPLIQVTDLRLGIALAHGAGALAFVDNTFATPALQRPLALGADIVMHSTTKYIGGHSDVHGGALVFAPGAAAIAERVGHVRHLLGAIASPFNCWLALRGLRTLACRVETQCRTAQAVAEAMARHTAIAQVHYPGLRDDPGHAIAAGQMSAFGGMISLRVRGGESAAKRAAGRVRVFTRATSLGGVESLLEHRLTSEGPGGKAPPELLRLSIGLEHRDDLIADLDQALETG
jgi:cystathionine gamma-synthase